MRFSAEHVEQWRTEGFTIIESFFERREYEPILADFERIYGAPQQRSGPTALARSDGPLPGNRAMQFANIHNFPFEGSRQLSMICLHPELIRLAKALLGVQDVRMYQAHTWAKFTGETDYDQEFHCDYGNHTLLVPSDDVLLRSVDFVMYLTDVTKAHGAFRYVTKPDSLDALGRQAVNGFTQEDHQALHAKERAAEVPAGSLLAHSIDTIHRGSNLTAPGGRRFSLTAGYKAAGNELLQFHVWQDQGNRPWYNVFRYATAEQLACLGIPRPGSPYWTQRTLSLTQARWPEWDMREYFAAAQLERLQER